MIFIRVFIQNMIKFLLLLLLIVKKNRNFVKIDLKLELILKYKYFQRKKMLNQLFMIKSRILMI
jgi:hypothetical protein